MCSGQEWNLGILKRNQAVDLLVCYIGYQARVWQPSCYADCRNTMNEFGSGKLKAVGHCSIFFLWLSELLLNS